MQNSFGMGRYCSSDESESDTLELGCCCSGHLEAAKDKVGGRSDGTRAKKRRLRFKQPPTAAYSFVLVYAGMLGIRPSQLYLMMVYRLPPVVFWIIQQMDKAAVNTVDTVEYFAGKKHWSQAMAAKGLKDLTFELNDDRIFQNFMSSPGFKNGLEMSMLAKEYHGFAWLAVLCSSWIWLSRGSTHRSERFPQGPKNCTAKVEHGNVMASRAALMMRLYAARRIESCLENPGNSLLPMFWRMAETIKLLALDSTKIYMGNFAGPSKKDMILWSQSSWTKKLYSKYDSNLQSELGLPLVIKTADGKVHGAAGLKDSQTYTPEFGAACAESYLQWREEVAKETKAFLILDDSKACSAPECLDPKFWQTTEPWDDAEMSKLAAELSLPNDRMPWQHA